MVSHEIKEIEEIYDRAIILHQSELAFYPDLQEAIGVDKTL